MFVQKTCYVVVFLDDYCADADVVRYVYVIFCPAGS